MEEVREEVVAAQELPVLDSQLCGVNGHCKLTVSVANMEEPCLLGLDSLFGNAVCDDLGRMQRQVCEVIPLILEGAIEQLESPVSSNVEEERLELHYRVVRKSEAADATEEACGGHAAVSSCGGKMNGGVRKADSVGSGWSEVGQQWDSSQHFDPDIAPKLGWVLG